jgi:hypothetical protein
MPECLVENEKNTTLLFRSAREEEQLIVKTQEAKWLFSLLKNSSLKDPVLKHFGEIASSFNAAKLGDFATYWQGETIAHLRNFGLLVF